MRAALFQGPMLVGSPAEMLAALARAATRAQSEGADLLVLPELFLSGYNIGHARLREAAEPANGPSAQAVSAIARAQRLAVLYGYPERGQDGRLYNSARLVAANGALVANYRKTHLFGDMEREIFTPGRDPFVLAEVAGLKVGILICYDVEFAEMARGLAVRGADLVAVPTALMQPYDFVPRAMVRTRAFENQVFLLYANRCGAEPPLEYVGESCIVGPDGVDLARAGDGETLLVATLDLAAAAKSRSLNTYLRDRTPLLYAEPRH